MNNRETNDEKLQQKHFPTMTIRRYIPLVIFVGLSILALQTPLLELTEEKLSTHMIIEHLVFFLIGALSVISAERILQLLHLRQRQKLLAIDQNIGTQKQSVSISSRLLLAWGNLLRKVFGFDRTGILWIGIVIILMGLWHFPRVFDTAAMNPSIHIIEHFCFIIVGAAGYISIRTLGESYRIFLLVVIIGMMGFAGLLFSVLDSQIYLAYPLWQHNEAGFYMVLTSTLLLVIGLPMYLVKRTITYVRATKIDRTHQDEY
jgi:cytochrome c oxidase assembly factor CtaG